jgi:hypothetical protein
LGAQAVGAGAKSRLVLWTMAAALCCTGIAALLAVSGALHAHMVVAHTLNQSTGVIFTRSILQQSLASSHRRCHMHTKCMSLTHANTYANQCIRMSMLPASTL